MLEDLGLNLYSSLSRVLVEFIANAYDADAQNAKVYMDFSLIKTQRDEMRKRWKQESDLANGSTEGVEPLENRSLPVETTISIADDGHGMSLDELRDKFLVAGRRRRQKDGTVRTSGGRLLMGRKGVGKLAGFGVARTIEVVSKGANEPVAYGIKLDFDQIMDLGDTKNVKVPTFEYSDDQGLGQQGTRVTLSKLVHESVKSGQLALRKEIGDHFVLVEQDDFAISLNNQPANPTPREFVYAWPKPELPVGELVSHKISKAKAGRDVEFQYRIRFVKDRSALRAFERGVRVYAHKRLAAAPSLLHADTNMHGFRMTDYLDGVVHADFLDGLDRDYIATDRQDLRWETPLLQPVHEFLGKQIKEACKKYQSVRDEQKKEEVKIDSFTQNLVESQLPSQRERILAYGICSKLASFHKKGVSSPEYQEAARQLVQGVGKGEIFTAISKISQESHPRLEQLAGEVTRLTHAEIDQAVGGIKTRVLAIKTLQRIVEATNFKKGNNEDEVHALLKESPWLIDPTYFEFLTSNRTTGSLFKLLEKHLGIDKGVPDSYDKNAEDEVEEMGQNRRPDLVFLCGNQSLGRVVIIELKAPNTPLHGDHLQQLRDYVSDTEVFLKNKQTNAIRVEGRLIGTLALERNHRKVMRLKNFMDDDSESRKIRVSDWMQVLAETLAAHEEFLDMHDSPEEVEEQN